MKSTKSLARQLGIIKKHLRHADHSNTTPRVTPQAFSYLVVIDFEATCWKNGEGPVGTQSEVIEFPAVLLNTATGEIEAEFHRYVQPQEHPYLSNFCTELTGITQDQVDHGIPLHICLAQFGRWLTSVQTDKSVHFVTGKTVGKNTANKWGTFVTWSDWDLGICLLYECRRKGISKPSALNCWLDLRATYKKFYGRKPNGLKGALRDLGIEFEGREHSGIEDARNTAKLAWRMMGDGCVMQVTKSLVGPTPQLKVTNQVITSPQAMQGLRTTSKSVNNSPSVQQRNVKSLPTSMLQEEGVVVKRTNGMNLPKDNGNPLLNSSSIHDASSTFSDSVTRTSSRNHSIGNQHLPPQSTSSMKKACATGSKYTAYKGKTTNMSAPRGKVFAQPLSSTRQGAQVYTSPASVQVQASTTKSTALLANLGKVGVKFAPTLSNHVPHTVTNDTGDKKECLNFGPCHPNTAGQCDPLTTQCHHHSRPNNKGADMTARGQPPANNWKSPSTEVEGSNAEGTLGNRNTASMFTTPKQVHMKDNRQSVRPSSSKTHSVASTGRNPLVIRTSRITPPFCTCGRRAKRRSVVNPGPNLGRQFWVCGTGRRDSAKSCNFFKWETLYSSRGNLNGSMHCNTDICSTGNRNRQTFPHGPSIEPPLPRMNLDDA
ncbi:PREDICTED: ERI1 exoribonuclease 2-like isoform X1 [Branchiostoma belcheri]|uniref:ERI1 exoribonuclease 2-like isoform X1 n=1 Tax=Branchiostoma belcheri TaxID=7741 RepID=A0A6P4YPL6_BRABE|nr:PREDICTED: ERI1 exoribonuclease 2-like isoform X1 [Branchiostoma belcheri]XP_019619126.1 PREDICTED: ERI1 exoribonuclease 2-like isoform X1 [Branchiostoma belcheri]